ncbi:Carboxylesterase type B [Apiospora saccharicola]|uniref:Carboxylesterase type B n=1 Tax=Apiospora saccharicola TaxID=335842 RepID=A0ABR1VBM6_9PEZI
MPAYSFVRAAYAVAAAGCLLVDHVAGAPPTPIPGPPGPPGGPVPKTFKGTAPIWPRYSGPDAQNIVFDVNVTDIHYTAKDDYRQEGIAYILDNVYN